MGKGFEPKYHDTCPRCGHVVPLGFNHMCSAPEHDKEIEVERCFTCGTFFEAGKEHICGSRKTKPIGQFAPDSPTMRTRKHKRRSNLPAFMQC